MRFQLPVLAVVVGPSNIVGSRSLCSSSIAICDGNYLPLEDS
jgi:hypothetical protein